jgi:bacterioferritin
MPSTLESAELLNLLCDAVTRELQVSVQYMMQHAVGAGRISSAKGTSMLSEQDKFIASHTMYFLPGDRLKKIAITEMRHAEAISELVVHHGGEPSAQPASITLGSTTREMLEVDQEQERSAIDLYTRIITVAESAQEPATVSLFQSILAEERAHHRTFTRLLAIA